MKNLFLMLLVACGGGGGGSDDPMTTPDASGGTLINGKPATEFYAQFAYATKMNEVSGAAAFPAQPDGRNAYLAQFFLMPNGKLVLFYAEGEGSVTSTGHSLNILGSTKKRREGSWRVDGADLVLDAFMRCTGFALNGKDALRCTLSSAIVTAAAQGKSGTFQNGIGTSSPDDSEFADYVP